MIDREKEKMVKHTTRGMSLNTHTNARKSLAKEIRDFKRQPKERRDVAGFRALVYAFSTLLHFFSFEKNIEVEERIEKIEDRLKEMEHEKH
ncbi:MAG: hypothetical protein AMS17_13695 [Spirochaetes bacterium DG_61]|jgi:hypothetical protein|nr:MAG: hypothetical protein AMS17_13695 [Spirochaetes bacterium DG_61]